MILAASLIVKDERARYLEPCIDHLAEFCDLIVVLDDGSTDGTIDWLAGRHDQIRIHSAGDVSFFGHEGAARQRLLECTLSWEPTHVLAIDADEFVDDGAALRRSLEPRDRQSCGLFMTEVWEADTDGLCIRVDRGWIPHSIPAIWRVPERLDGSWRIADRALACGRVPAPVDQMSAAPVATVLHFGWANEAERQARYDRYAEHDQGRFHASAHLDSIMWGCDRVQLRAREWPAALTPWKDAILERASGEYEDVWLDDGQTVKRVRTRRQIRAVNPFRDQK